MVQHFSCVQSLERSDGWSPIWVGGGGEVAGGHITGDHSISILHTVVSVFSLSDASFSLLLVVVGGLVSVNALHVGDPLFCYC